MLKPFLGKPSFIKNASIQESRASVTLSHNYNQNRFPCTPIQKRVPNISVCENLFLIGAGGFAAVI
jgi:hypothetical protein